MAGRFKLTVALCDGTPASLQALVASFRDMRPYLLHMWQLKNFWHRGALCFRDVDIQRWARAGDPSRRRGRDGSRAGRRRRGRFPPDCARGEGRRGGRANSGGDEDAQGRLRGTRARRAHELSSFWLRKTRKPVLAVLCVVKATRAGRCRRRRGWRSGRLRRGRDVRVSSWCEP